MMEDVETKDFGLRVVGVVGCGRRWCPTFDILGAGQKPSFHSSPMGSMLGNLPSFDPHNFSQLRPSDPSNPSVSILVILFQPNSSFQNTSHIKWFLPPTVPLIAGLFHHLIKVSNGYSFSMFLLLKQ
ncbi:hypothetical protein Gohar_006979 [Gossypium harknessii]|uniref:DET1- and DDB1-associated protein 1 domain-containing protein n=1 Tax=Gossypium harknessii TaxID=34285 RepID=A0A7J9GFC9_9ROSI|nr:hypothetical protein [Gossypium harknessii]